MATDKANGAATGVFSSVRGAGPTASPTRWGEETENRGQGREGGATTLPYKRLQRSRHGMGSPPRPPHTSGGGS